MKVDKHTLRLEHLMKSNAELSKLGIENRIWCAKELPYYRNGQLYCEVDLLIYTGNYFKKSFFSLEYKCGDNDQYKAEKQLKRAEMFVREMFNADTYKVYVYGENYEFLYIGDTPKKR